MHNKTTNEPIDLSRRRLAKTGLAAPIVLATLASKNALAAPYSCTVSGKLSGGSTHTAAPSCKLGQSAATLAGGLTNDTTTFLSAFGLDLYYYKGGTTPKIGNSTVPGSSPATLYQILTVSSEPNILTRKPTDLPFAKMAVMLYLNAPVSGDIYPLTKAQVVAMFTAAIQGNNYTGSTSMGSFTWTPAQVKSYFSELYI